MKHIKRSLGAGALKNMVELAQDEPGIPITIEKLNQHSWLLPCANGTVDLKTGDLRRHARQDLLTECLTVAYNPDAICPTWEAFLWRIMGGTSPGTDTPEMNSKILEQRPQADNRAKTMIQGKFDFGFPVEWMRKDLKICLEEANRNGALLPITALIDQYYHQVVKSGGRRWDTSSLIHNLQLTE